MKNNNEMNQLVCNAVQGSKTALEEIIREIQKYIYSLSLRMLFDPEDAEDTTQEILITIITNLQGYRQEGPFRAWIMRIAYNKIKAARKSRIEKKMSTINNLEEIIDRYEAKNHFKKQQDIPQPYLEAETRSICIHAILMCLDRSHRMAFISGVVLEVSGKEGAQILDISESAYRKQLSRARKKIKDFLIKNCCLFNEANRCSCKSILPKYLHKGWIKPDKPRFIPKNTDGDVYLKTGKYLKEMDDLKKLSFIYNSIPPFDFDFIDTVKDIYQNKRYQITSDP